MLASFQEHQVAARHFAPSTGYGYDDIGRDTLDLVFAGAVQAEAALVRPHFVNGTHAIFLALAGLAEPGDQILAITGRPYDTLEEAIGIRGNAPQSLRRFGIGFEQVPLRTDGEIDLDTVMQLLQERPRRIVYVQRSRGYGWRNSLRPDQMQKAFSQIMACAPDSVIVVDNCYGEFTCAQEPNAFGAHILAGSLIKNPGGGLAPTGGYVAGRADLVERIAQRLTVPGMGREVGSYAGDYRRFTRDCFWRLTPWHSASKAQCCLRGCLNALAWRPCQPVLRCDPTSFSRYVFRAQNS